jgi:hypothetical membrane protein
MFNKIINNTGILAVLVLIVFTQIAVLSYPGYDQSYQFVSELGAHEKSAIWLNSGLVIAGALLFVFFSRFQKRDESQYKQIALLGMAAGIAMIGIGIFPFQQRILHVLTAASFFVLMGATILIYSQFQLQKNPSVAWFGFIVILLGIIYFALNQNTIIQRMSGGAILFWIIWFAWVAKEKS